MHTDCEYYPILESQQQRLQDLSIRESHQDRATAAAAAAAKLCGPSGICFHSQSENDRINTIRRRMVQRLHRVIGRLPQQRQCSIQTHKAALALERYLFRRSSLQEYQDWPTIKERLRSILIIRLCQRSLKGKKRTESMNATACTTTTATSATTNNPDHPTSSSSSSSYLQHNLLLKPPLTLQSVTQRTDVLMQVLGNDLFQRVQALVRRIQTVKLQQVVSLKGCCSGAAATCPLVPYNNNNNNNNNNKYQANFTGRFPVPVKDLFFHTTLVQAFEVMPVDKLEMLSWTRMIEEAENNLQAFEEYNNNDDDDDDDDDHTNNK
ncbi:hypothetical protein IV203_027157 [Nitzschia inconspicua]|uniref:Uncharacterized protein n=1 Tax=Nitzschia inconspicua TaxID=303405 RepID=A0A9K3LNV2_9STRA|nr:hypothetical protein IV203_027157 [Nitzschia inconspicua]